ncbi:hypothetical protein [Streptomyces sp. NPDC090029]|uniref:hypothetical protein n=1 Tax=Streptomyces sp. NPDC090029 TaxID=3365924 RepID=UPI0037FB818C
MCAWCDDGVGLVLDYPFTGVSPRHFSKPATALRRKGADPVHKGRSVPGNSNDRKAWALTGTKEAVSRTTLIADDGYRGTEVCSAK